MYTIDFETKAIQKGSPLSPKPVGVSIKHGSLKSRYFAWGHPTENNCNYNDAKEALTVVSNPEFEVVMHNAKFDARIIMEWFNIPILATMHDTMVMAFLAYPYEQSLCLKYLAQKYLGMEPDEQLELRDWIVKHVKGATVKNWGAYISYGPGSLVGKYAGADTDMTHGLYLKLKEVIDAQSMQTAYRLEMDLVPVFIEMEKFGVPIADNINEALKFWTRRFDDGEEYLKSVVGDIKLGGKAMFNKLRVDGYINEDNITYTDKGNPQYGRALLPNLISDEKLRTVLEHRSKLQKVIGTYLNPWADAYNKDGRFFPYFNQTRGEEFGGTRTGRVSSDLQQIPAFYDPTTTVVPNLRTFIVPEKGHVLLKRDYSAQEIRVAAHYAEGSILQAYQNDPLLDVHTFVKGLILDKTGWDLQRPIVKAISFLKLYGGGPRRLMDTIECSFSEAAGFFDAYNKALPEFLQLTKDVEAQVKNGIMLRTWGGRLYDVEPGKHIKGIWREFYYKLVNTLIQGSSADMSKTAMKRYHYHPDRKGRILLVVHDEIIVTCPKERIHEEMKLLKWAMEEIPGWDVPLISDAKIGHTFGDLEEYHGV